MCASCIRLISPAVYNSRTSRTLNIADIFWIFAGLCYHHRYITSVGVEDELTGAWVAVNGLTAGQPEACQGFFGGSKDGGRLLWLRVCGGGIGFSDWGLGKDPD